MVMYSFTNGTTADADEVNNNFTHVGTSGTTTVSFTPTDATTKVHIVCVGSVTHTSDIGAKTVNLTSSADGTLDSVVVTVDGGGGANAIPYTLHYFGSLSATAHTINTTDGGGTGTINTRRITVLEFLS